MKVLKEKAESGQMLIEPLLAIAIFGLLLAPFLGSIGNLAHSQVKYRHQVEAVQYAREGLEIVYNIAVNADDWSDYFITGDNPHLGIFHPNLSGGNPDLASESETVGGRFTREINIAKAKRDSNGNLDETTDTDDDHTIKVVSKITWEEAGQLQKIELTTYLINLGAL